jgi:hypothetical protein
MVMQLVAPVVHHLADISRYQTVEVVLTMDVSGVSYTVVKHPVCPDSRAIIPSKMLRPVSIPKVSRWT